MRYEKSVVISSVVFTISLVAVLVTTLIFTYYYYASHVSNNNLTFWCHNDWICPQTIPDNKRDFNYFHPRAVNDIPVSECFNQKYDVKDSKTGLAMCLYNAPELNNCVTTASEQTSCDCPFKASVSDFPKFCSNTGFIATTDDTTTNDTTRIKRAVTDNTQKNCFFGCSAYDPELPAQAECYSDICSKFKKSGS